MDKFLERYKFPRLNQEELENINRSQVKKLKLEFKIFQQSPGPDGFTDEFY